MLEWDEEDGDLPDSVDSRAVNKRLFNADTVDKVLAGGTNARKTIVKRLKEMPGN